ncbi:single-stranded DNA-binding protein [Candidatus Gracilibacteria bacterium]|nr:single-stranded DNA-binding protein [Candidatus Gracilibacteria bacterium]
MRSINKVIIVGNLTRDPELKQTQSGQPVATFGIATNREWATRDNDRKKSTEFHEVVAWARLAEICAQYLRKGKLVYIEGYLKTRSWESESGEKRFRTEVVMQDMIMLDKRAGSPEEEKEILDAVSENSTDLPVYGDDEGENVF